MQGKTSNDVSIREHLEIQLVAIKESIRYEHEAGRERDLAYRTQSELVASSLDLRFNALDQRDALAREVNNTRLDSMNEFRDSINDMLARMIMRIEVEDKIKAIMTVLDAKETRILALETKIANFEGRLWAVSGGIGLVSVITSVVLHFLH